MASWCKSQVMSRVRLNVFPSALYWPHSLLLLSTKNGVETEPDISISFIHPIHGNVINRIGQSGRPFSVTPEFLLSMSYPKDWADEAHRRSCLSSFHFCLLLYLWCSSQTLVVFISILSSSVIFPILDRRQIECRSFILFSATSH